MFNDKKHEGVECDGSCAKKNIVIVQSLRELELHCPRLLENAFVFATVRNPYDRFISGWQWTCASRPLIEVLRSPPQWPEGYEWPLAPTPPIDKPTIRQMSLYTHVWSTATERLTAGGVFRCDDLIRLESYRTDVKRVLERIGLSAPDKFPHQCKRGGKRGHEWTPSERVRFNERFHVDCENLGYPIVEG